MAYIKSDEIHVDTSHAPWMDFAIHEEGKKIREIPHESALTREMRLARHYERVQAETSQAMETLESESRLLGSGPQPHYTLLDKRLPDYPGLLLGSMESSDLKSANPEIDKYFDGLKTDPSYNKKQRSYSIDSTHAREDHGYITAWCAAFVNWCLKQAKAPYLNYATARSWLDFGTPVASPVYGCVTIIRPSANTGSTTGHVAFYVRTQGTRVELLGGNQSDQVKRSTFPSSWVLGYRWPTRINHYLLASNVTV